MKIDTTGIIFTKDLDTTNFGSFIDQDPIYTSAPSPKQIHRISIYPNPANEVFNLEVGQESLGSLLQVYNITGQKVLEQRIAETLTPFGHDLEPGMYLITIRNSDNQQTQKTIVKR